MLALTTTSTDKTALAHRSLNLPTNLLRVRLKHVHDVEQKAFVRFRKEAAFDAETRIGEILAHTVLHFLRPVASLTAV